MIGALEDLVLPGPTLRKIYRVLSSHIGESPRKIEYYARFLREADFLEAGRPGRGGHTPVATPDSVAALIIALLGSATAVDAPDAVRKFGTLPGEALDPLGRRRGPSSRLPEGQFQDALTSLIEQLRNPSTRVAWKNCLHWVGVRSSADAHEAVIAVGSGQSTIEHDYGRSPVDLTNGLVRQNTLGADVIVKLAANLGQT